MTFPGFVWRFKTLPMSRKLLVLAFGAVFTMAAVVGMHDAWAVKLTLKRVIFEGTKRTESLTVINNTADKQVFRLAFKSMRMSEENALIDVAETDPEYATLKTADKMIVFAPRRIEIPAGGSQQIRLMLRKPKDLEAGEYRSHLWINPEKESVKFEPNPNASKDKPEIQIKMLAGISVPVFVRHGNVTATVSLSDIKAVKNNNNNNIIVSLVINREGNRSVYGDFDFVCTGGGAEIIAYQLRGIAVYTEVEKRNMRFAVPVPKDGAQACKTMRVIYTADTNDVLFRGAKMAEATVTLP